MYTEHVPLQHSLVPELHFLLEVACNDKMSYYVAKGHTIAVKRILWLGVWTAQILNTIHFVGLDVGISNNTNLSTDFLCPVNLIARIRSPFSPKP